MGWIMKLVRNEGANYDLPDPTYLEAFDLDFMGGVGFAKLTTNIDQALVFPDIGTLLATWKTPSRVRPRRPDGRPNRPLTAYTIEPTRL